MLMGLVALSPAVTSAMLLHMTGYIITNLAAFTAIIAYHNQTDAEEMNDFKGMSDRAPLLAAITAVALFSLAGMPLFAGFFTKFIFFASVADAGYLWLASVAVFVQLHQPLLLPDRPQGRVHRPGGRALAPEHPGVHAGGSGSANPRRLLRRPLPGAAVRRG